MEFFCKTSDFLLPKMNNRTYRPLLEKSIFFKVSDMEQTTKPCKKCWRCKSDLSFE
jgi:hypothetical protein